MLITAFDSWYKSCTRITCTNGTEILIQGFGILMVRQSKEKIFHLQGNEKFLLEFWTSLLKVWMCVHHVNNNIVTSKTCLGKDKFPQFAQFVRKWMCSDLSATAIICKKCDVIFNNRSSLFLLSLITEQNLLKTMHHIIVMCIFSVNVSNDKVHIQRQS